jgi:signal transduction histidine kinase
MRVFDSGMGITENIQEQIFRPFFTTKEVGNGTGLGLSISSGIIHNHNGKIYLDKTQSHTCFVVELPIAK